MSKWVKGQSGNPAGSKKTEFKESFDNLQAKIKMHTEGLQILNENWHDVVYAMVQQANKGNVQAASFLRDTFIGKPKEVVQHETSEEISRLIIKGLNE